MNTRTLCCAALAVLVFPAGCDSPDQAEGRDRADGGPARPARRRAEAARPQPPDAAQQMAQIDQCLAACPDFDRRLAGFRADLDRLSASASRVAALRPTLDDVDRLRATKVSLLGQPVNLWVALCRLSPGADAMNPVLAEASRLVRRCEQIVRLKAVVASDCRLFNGALAKARRRPAAQTLADVRQAAGGLHTRIGLVEKARSELDGKLAPMEAPLRAGRDALNAVAEPSLRSQAGQIAHRLGRLLAAVTSARRQLRQHRSRIAKAADALNAIALIEGR